ncbi:MAG: TPM domain-containing protein, partial [Clostridia bacterium]|nr:TPM domain-containing protein [Clostridia bacterium]
ERVMVRDDADLYSAAEKATMEELIRQMNETYQVDITVLTTYDVPYSNGRDEVTVDYADRYFEDQGYGLGQDRSGMVLLLDMTNRFNYLSTAGIMIDYLNTHRIEEVLSSADNYLYSGQYGSAMIAELRQVQRFLQKGIEEGSFRFDAVTGERLSGIYNPLTQSELLMAIVAGAAVALIMYFSIQKNYAMKDGTNTYRYPLGSISQHLSMHRDDEVFLRQHVTRQRILRDTSSGGGSSSGGHSSGSAVHTSSGGMSHGGGGHHF